MSAELSFQATHYQGTNGTQITLAKVGGAIDQSTVRNFDEKLNSLYDNGCRCLLLDFSEVRYINSTGMGLMVKVADRFTDDGGSLHLVDVSRKIRDLFDMLGLLSLFTIHASSNDALAKLGAKGVGGSAPAKSPSTVADVPTHARPVRTIAPAPAAARLAPVRAVEAVEAVEVAEVAEAVDAFAGLEDLDDLAAPPLPPPPSPTRAPTKPATSSMPAARAPSPVAPSPGAPSLQASPLPASSPLASPPPRSPTPSKRPPSAVSQTAMTAGPPSAARPKTAPGTTPPAAAPPAPAPIAAAPAPIAAAPAPIAAAPVIEGYPRDYTCPCGGVLELPQPGSYCCPRCHTYFRVSSRTGDITDYASLNPHILNISLPVSSELVPHLEAMIAALLKIRQFPDHFIRELLAASRSICDIVVQKSKAIDTLHVIAVANQNEAVLGFKPSNNAFTAGHKGGDPRLRSVANRVDRIELFPLASRGELLKVIKRAQ